MESNTLKKKIKYKYRYFFLKSNEFSRFFKVLNKVSVIKSRSATIHRIICYFLPN